MKKGLIIVAVFCVFFSALLTNNAQASHAAGGELVYEWVSGNTYRFIFKFYRDCGGAIEPGQVTLCWKNGCTNQNGSIPMFKRDSIAPGVPNGIQVSTGCANQKSKCDSLASSIPGYREWWYDTVMTLPSACADWKFSVSIGNRNPSDNLQNSQFQIFYVETALNNVDAPGNSSPFFSVKPVPYVCLNQNYQYNNGGVDVNNDSLVFEVIRPLTVGGSSCNAVPFNTTFQSASPAYSIPNNPFQTNNTFTINQNTGELSFTAAMQGSHTVTVRANEYRNGTFIGSVIRDIQVQVITCVGGQSVKPTVKTDSASVSGGAIYSSGTVLGCSKNQFTFCYDITSTDTAAKLVASDNHDAAAPGSSTSYTGALSDTMRGCFTWTPGPTDTGTRNFTVVVKDSSCSSGAIPISYVFSIPLYVTPVTAAIKDTSICIGQSTQLNAVGGTAYLWSVLPGGASITSLSCTNCKQPIASPTVTTSYVVTSNSAALCGQNKDTLTVTVKSLPSASATSNAPVCPGDTLKLFGNTVAGATYTWVGPNSFSSTQQNPFIPNAQTINSGYYGLTVTKDGCNSTQFVLQAYVGPPDGPDAGANTPVCLGNNINLTASTISGTTVTYHWTGPNGFTSNQQNPTRSNATFSDSGKYYVYAMKDGCMTFSDSIYVEIKPLPAAPVATVDTVTYCQGATASQLTANGTNLKWYTVPTGGSWTATLTPSTTNAGVFKYYVSQTDGFGCEGPRDTVTVIILAKPAPPTVTSPQAYCQGATIPQLTATGTNLKWYVTPTGGSPLSSAPTPSSSAPGNTTYYVSQTDGTTGCESDRAAIQIIVAATPNPPVVNSPVQYCEGSSVTPPLASFVNGFNIKWYTTASGGTGSSTPPAVNTSTARVDTYYVSQTLGICEGTRAQIIVIIQANPAPPQTFDTSYCQFETADTARAIGQNLLWYNVPIGGIGNTAAPTPPTGIAGTIKYYVSQTVSGCESARDSVTVTIKPKPAIPVGNDDSICQESMAGPLTATGTNLKWYDTAIGGIGSSTAPTPPTVNDTTLYWYVSQTVNGCESDRDTVEIVIKPKPDRPDADSAEFCLNGPSKQLTATGQNLLWYTAAVGGVGSSTAPTPPTTPIGTTFYYVSQTVDGCESDRDTAVVEVDTLVTTNLYFSDSIFCMSDTIEVGQVGLIADTGMFTWTWDGGKVIEGDSSGPYKIKWDSDGTKRIIVFAEDNGCKTRDTGMVEVLPLPEAYFNMVPEICLSNDYEMVLDTMLKHAAKYNWTFDSVSTVFRADSTGFALKWQTPGTHIVTLQTISDSGCLSPVFADTINVKDVPNAQILTADKSTVCTRNEITFKAESLPGLHTYEWSPVEYFITNKASEVKAVIPSSGYINIMVTDQYGCIGVDSIYVQVQLCCKVSLPNAFTPNGDGKNDVFRIISNGHHKIRAFRVVNRYGQVVFTSNNQYDSWDGTFNGKPQDIGTYYYFIKYTCEDDDGNNEVEERGDVILMR